MTVVLCEIDPHTGEIDEVSREALVAARSLSDASALHAAIVGPLPDTHDLPSALGAYGVTEAHHLGGEALSAFAGAAWAAAVLDLHERVGGEVLMAGGTARGNEVMAHVATRLDVPMAANTIGFDGGKAATVSRQVAGGAAVEQMRLASPAVLTVAGHAWPSEPPDGRDEPVSWSTSEPDIAAADLRARVVRTSDPEPDESQALTSAKVVVGAGRGAGGPDGFGPVSELAELLGGAVGVSRVVTSLGWRPHHEQVGQTGSRIAPDVYIACGISGAIQHWAGCASSRTIIAINTDPEAPMMTRATYAVVGDMHEVVPAVVEVLRGEA